MTQNVTLFHTSASHIDRFNSACDKIAPSATLTHEVRTDWLKRAGDGHDFTLETEITTEIQSVPGTVLCTCTSIADAAEKAGAIRVDLPMMYKAAQLGGPVLLAYCLDSAYEPALNLLRRAFGDNEPTIVALHLGSCWPLFEGGDVDRFESAIAELIDKTLDQVDVSCVVLAQASMAGAAHHVESSVPVLSSVESALRTALEI